MRKFISALLIVGALFAQAHAQNMVQVCDDPGAAARAPFAETQCATFAPAAPADDEVVLTASSPTYNFSATEWAVEDTLAPTAWIWATDAGWVLKSQVAFPQPPPTTASVVTIRVNAGGPAYTDSAGNVWSADTDFTGGATVNWALPTNGGLSISSISGTSDPTLFLTERYGTFQYAFALPNGSYTVYLYFAENWVNSTFPNGGIGDEVFSTQANGVTIVSNLDVFATVGAHAALIKSATVKVTTGQLVLSSPGNWSVNAIEVVGQGAASGSAPAPPVVPSASAAKTLFRFPKTQAGWNQAMLSAPGSVIFPIYDPDYVGTDFSYRDPLIDANIDAAQSRGLKVFAYVDGLDSEQPSSAVEAPINTWVTQLAKVGEHVDGVFIGDAGHNAGVGDGQTYASYWINVINWVHATYGVPVFIHPGGLYGTASDDQQILTVADSIVMAEGYFPYLASNGAINYASYPPPFGNGNPATGTPDYSAVAPLFPQTWMPNYNRSKFCAMANGVAAADLANVENFFLANNVGYLYITDVDEGATDTPAYWSQELAALIQPP